MAASGTIGIRLVLQGALQAQRGIADLARQTDGLGGAGKRAAKGFAALGDRALLGGAKALGVGVAGVGVAALGAAAGMAALAKTSLDSLARIERINAQTEAAIKSTGSAAGVTAKHVEDLAGALESTTASEAESIQQGANWLLTFKGVRNEAGAGNDVFDQTVKVMNDMARAMDTTGNVTLDMTSQANMLGKALNDPAKGISKLTKVGVTFSTEQENMIKQLSAAGDVMGAQKVMLAALEEQFGGSAEAFAKTATGQVELAKHAFGTFGEAMTTALLPAMGAVSTEIADTFNYLAEEVAPKAEGAFTRFGDSAAAALKRVTDGIRYVSGNSSKIGDEISAAASGMGSGGLASSIGMTVGLDASQVSTLTPVLDSVFAKGQQIATVLATAFSALQSIPISPLNLLNGALTWAATNTGAFKTVLIGLGAAYLAIKATMLGFAAAQALSTAKTALSTAATSANAAATRLWNSSAGMSLRLHAMYAAGWARSTAMIVANRIATTAAAVANRAVAIGMGVATAAQWLLNAAMTANPIGIVVAAIALLVGGLVLFFTKTEVGRRAWDAITGAFKSGVAWIKDVAVPVIKGGLAVAIDGLKAGFDRVKNGIGGFIDKIKSAWDWVKKLADRIKDSAIGKAISAVTGGSNPEPRAKGGPVSARTTYLVGERGPELFVPSSAGKIVNNAKLSNDLSGSLADLQTGGSYTAVVNLDGREIARNTVTNVRQQMRRA